MKHYKTPFLLALALAACGGNARKQTLPSVEEMQAEKFIVNTRHEAAVVMDTVIPNPGVKYKERRTINPSSPPVTLHVARALEEKPLSLSAHYSSVKLIKLAHPFAEQERGFLDSTNFTVTFEDGGSIHAMGMESSAYLTDNHIVVGDPVFGYHAYDREGNFEYTIASMEEPPPYGDDISVRIKPSERLLSSISTIGDNCFILSIQSGRRQYGIELHDLATRKTYLSRPIGRDQPKFINADSYIAYRYDAHAPYPSPFMYSFEAKGDTLCRFINHNPVPPRGKGEGARADRGAFYHHDDLLTIRQSYNDTVYRVTSPRELTAAYVLDLGDRAPDIYTALYGDKTGKLLPGPWIETGPFVLVAHTENYDIPVNREKHAVKFFYSHLDKATGKLYRLPGDDFPENLLLPNDVTDGLPFMFANVQSRGKNLYVKYTRSRLEALANHASFASLPAEQQAKTRAALADLKTGELLLMILE
ncbi:MAG: DUF4933 domain-containing protein [Odoribacteraceae bacterium]|jgi:hypothetical protein|nr:DUF4933 domain-containing protein [Odoribacteraceae bacterium]